MEIPSSHAGVVKELKVKLGDKIAEGSVLLTLETAQAAAPAAAPAVLEQKPAPAPAAQAQAAIKTEAKSFAGSADLECDVLVLGGGPGGYSAAFRAADLGLKVVLVERYAQLGGVCLNVGCIPSKALLHVAAVMDEVSHMADLGVDFGAPTVNVDKLRGHKEKVIAKLTGGLGLMSPATRNSRPSTIAPPKLRRKHCMSNSQLRAPFAARRAAAIIVPKAITRTPIESNARPTHSMPNRNPSIFLPNEYPSVWRVVVLFNDACTNPCPGYRSTTSSDGRGSIG